MSQAGVINSSGGGGTPITTINGDTGSATGATILIYADNAGVNSGATVKFENSGTTSTFNVTDGSANTLMGLSAGNLSLSGIANTGFGQACLNGLSTGIQNTATGQNCLVSVSSGTGNSGFGYLAGQGITTSVNNTCVGVGTLSANCGNNNNAFGVLALQSCTGSSNLALGNNCLQALLSGTFNVALGETSGNAYTGAETGNILISNVGVVGESLVTRIGNAQTKCFIAGISGVTVAASVAVLIDANGQMGTILSSERYKENIVDMPEDVSVLNLRPIKFNYKSDENKIEQYGLLAEDVARDFPYLAIYKDGQPETVKYHELCVFLLAEIQRLEKRISNLEGK